MRKIAKFKATREYARMAKEQAAQQKAPGLTTGGSAWSGDEAQTDWGTSG